MWYSAAYLLENVILVLSRGGAFAPHFLSPPCGIYMNARPHCEAFAAFPKQNDKCPTNARGRGMGTLGINCINKLFQSAVVLHKGSSPDSESNRKHTRKKSAKFWWQGSVYSQTGKTVNNSNISGMLLCCKKKANQA